MTFPMPGSPYSDADVPVGSGARHDHSERMETTAPPTATADEPSTSGDRPGQGIDAGSQWDPEVTAPTSEVPTASTPYGAGAADYQEVSSAEYVEGAEEAENRGGATYSAEAATLLAQMHGRFDRIESAISSENGTVARNYEQSLIVLRDRAVAAETGVSHTLLRPIARQMAALIDRVELEASRRQADPWSLTASLVDELLDILEDFGVETIECTPGTEVDKARHRVVRSSAGRSDQNDELRIVERIRQGYEIGGYVVRPAEVAAEWVSHRPTYS
ncbi:hypothetical protein GOACH_24_00210 [Gordonia aichiensis NBRC 108223]|uniref:Nucleotide exchange factor GrpE n=2 Tax=Gordonia aichiensis TaxID=36820 RepID=L7KNE9_9ACTN|nr:hypothetical protein GOACH_24_00210 [Gordonia aichiensis NBRC 108223]